MILIFDTFETPLGQMTAVFSRETLVLLDFSDSRQRIDKLLKRRFPDCEVTTQENPGNIRGHVRAYFDGNRNAFKGIVFETGGTPFQQSVWQALRDIPSGQTLSYKQLAEKVDRPRAVRAVGAANGKNPLALLIPCHRVIGNDGSLTGYAGGVARKKKLLELEEAL